MPMRNPHPALIGTRYFPQATARLLAQLEPDAGWKRRRVEELVTAVRQRLSRLGVPGLTADEVPQPIGNMLNHNLIQQLMQSGTLVPRDLALIDFDSEN
ncbi:hypothetical protein [Nocardia blacklockiae]|uniref:hypothetical protein n=1 Tax=Nocardia blacklockiae TaxID=480036 RepID=UPI001894872C|nr:hypothetical protein [Nocardia blacklockiae]MBF6175152.1 hypothetical protein [Nocardia blacklockiae]